MKQALKPTILVLGASGLLGNAVFRVLSENPTWNVLGTLREGSLKARFSLSLTEKLIHPIDVTCADRLDALMSSMNPSVVVNCIGLTKHVPSGSDAVSAYTMNALLPHRLAALCANADARLIHVSTDCVFSGLQGMYLENDKTDAADIYGQSKAAGPAAGPSGEGDWSGSQPVRLAASPARSQSGLQPNRLAARHMV